MAFDGFVAADFALFALPTFETRMPEIRRVLTPKLKALAAELGPELQAALGSELYPHVALHMRRTANAPDATWAAFSPSRRAYKPHTHYRVTVHSGGIRVTVFEEDSSEDRLRFAQAISAQAGEVATFLRAREGFGLFESGKRSACYPGATITPTSVGEVAARVLASPHGHIAIGVEHSSAEPRLRDAAAFLRLAVADAQELHPFYRLGLEDGCRL